MLDVCWGRNIRHADAIAATEPLVVTDTNFCVTSRQNEGGTRT